MISSLAPRRTKEEDDKSASNILKVCGKDLEELRVLGVGGQGSVSLCKDTDSGRLFALKTAAAAASDELANEYDTVRFLMDSGIREGIVQVHSIDKHKDSGEICVLMDFCDAGDLMSELKRHPGGRLEDRQAAAVVRSVSESLSRCHELGIMHRDIKPENILLCHAHHARVGHGAKRRRGRTGKVDPWPLDLGFVLADFGLSCEFQKGHRIKDGYVVGTDRYIAPEMVKGAYDERADVWSLGVLLHLLLTGDFPSHIHMASHQQERDDDADTLLLRAMELCPDEIDLGAPMYSGLPEGACSLLAGMLRKNPRHRLTLPQVRAHPWLHPLPTPHPEDIEEDTSAPHHAGLFGIKRVRFTMAGFHDVVREVQLPNPAVVGAMAQPGPLIVPEEVQLLEFNPLALLAAY